MKKAKSLVLVLLVALFAVYSVPSYAQTTTEEEIVDIISPYSYTQSTSLSLDIIGNTAAVYGSISGYHGTTTKVSMYLYLQRYENGLWKTVSIPQGLFNTYYGSVYKSVAITSGYQYRVKASFYAFSGSAFENIVKYTSVKWA